MYESRDMPLERATDVCVEKSPLKGLLMCMKDNAFD